MRDSLRQAYNTFYSQREWKSASPSSGRIHKTRQSYGPTLCLINKSTQSEQLNPNQSKIQILLLILEIQRLNKIIRTISQASATTTTTSHQTTQLIHLRQQITNLTTQLDQLQHQHTTQLTTQNKLLQTQSIKLSQYQTQLSITHRKNQQQNQLQLSHQQQIKLLQSQLQKYKNQLSSKTAINNLMNSQTELRKSLLKEKSSAEIQLWKQKLSKYQHILNQQKNFILEQKRTIDKLNNTQLQIKHHYEYQLSMLKKTNEQLTAKYTQLQRQTSSKLLSSTTQAHHQLNARHRQLTTLKQKLLQLQKQNQQLKNALNLTSKNKNQNINQMTNVINQLRQSLEQINNQLNIKTNKYNKIKQLNTLLKKQNDKLKAQLKNNGNTYDNKITNLQQQLSAKQLELKRIQKTTRKLQNQAKLHHSHSTSNLKTSTTSNPSNPDLRTIIQEVIELQNANSRVNQLIQNKSRSQVYQQRTYKYSDYGL